MPTPERDTAGPWVICPACDEHSITVSTGSFTDYLNGETETCQGCGKSVDLFAAFVATLTKDMFIGMSLAPVGARFTKSEIRLRPGEMQKVRISDHGVPTDARIIEIQYGGISHGVPPKLENTLFPVEFYGSVPMRHDIPVEVDLVPVPFGPGPYAETVCSLVIVWVPHSGDDVSMGLLSDAFVRFGRRDYHGSIIPGNTAVESALAKYLSDYLKNVASADSVSRFLTDGATYSHQLNVVMPLIVTLTGAPKLSDSIRGQLNRLRKLRNEIGHSGSISSPLERRDATELLVAAAFGFHYVRLLRDCTMKSDQCESGPCSNSN